MRGAWKCGMDMMKGEYEDGCVVCSKGLLRIKYFVKYFIKYFTPLFLASRLSICVLRTLTPMYVMYMQIRDRPFAPQVFHPALLGIASPHDANGRHPIST